MTDTLSTLLPVETGVQAFLKQWVKGWNDRDTQALATLHTDDAVTINRYGTLLQGRADSEAALSFLLGPGGPFGDALFPPMEISALREIVPGIAITQVTWSAPVLGSDGKTVPGEFNEMILTYTLVRLGDAWLATQIDGHNIEPMDLPFSSSDQKS